MKQVTILGLADTSATMITGPLDVFHFAGRMWNYIFNQPLTPFFEPRIVSPDGGPVRCLGNVSIEAHQSMHDVPHTDLLLIPSILDIDQTLARQPEVIPWIQSLYDKGAHVAAMCTGTFVLAETGLLDGRTATTHWGMSESFRLRYPQIDLKPERLISDAGDIFTAGGSNACFDLALFLVGKYCGRETARKLAKTFLHDLDRISQAPWAVLQCQQRHTDRNIRRVQDTMEQGYTHRFNFDDLAREAGMSRRTFERRFKRATGDTPLHYLHRIRVEAAKRMLETENRSFDEIVYAVGYEDCSFFRKIFGKLTGLSPKTYRMKWAGPSTGLATAG